MKLNIFEQKQLTQINKTDKLLKEGLGSKIFKYMFGRKFKKIMQGIKQEEDFPEYQSILKNLKTTFEDIEDKWDEGEEVLSRMAKERDEIDKRIKKADIKGAEYTRRYKELEKAYGFKVR